MTNATKRLVLATAVALAASGSVLADSGDNSMSPFTGESYAAFNGGTLGSGYPLAERSKPATESDEAVAGGKGSADVIIGLPRGYTNPFRDDTAA